MTTHTSTTTTTSTSTPAAAASGPLDPIGADLTRTLRALKLGGLKDTLPERLCLARQRKMGHVAFLELLLSDEVTRRESRSAMLRARTAGLDPTMRLDTWDEPDDLTYDRTLLSDLTSLRFADAGHGVLILGPVGVGKTHLATALGHIAIRRRLSVHAARTDKLFTRLRATRLDNTLEAEMRKLARVDLLILDDFALRALDATETNDFYELVVERHRKAATIVTSNREPSEWMSMMSDALLAQSAIDRLTSQAHTLIIEGPSYRQRDRLSQRASVDTESEARDAH
jgi:DNA replication protein DnaC